MQRTRILQLVIGAAVLTALACGGPTPQTTEPQTISNQVSSADTDVADRADDAERDAVEGGIQGGVLWSPPPIPRSPAPAPQSLLGTFAVPDPAGELARWGAFVDAIQPGMGSAISEPQLDGAIGGLLFGLPSMAIDGLDYQQPIRGLLLDPKQQSMPVVLIAGVADEQALRASVEPSGRIGLVMHRGHAAIGTYEALEAAAPHALSAMLDQPLPPRPTLSIDVVQTMATYRDEIEMVVSLIDAQVAGNPDLAESKQALDLMLSFARQTERVDLSMSPTGTAVTADATLAAAPGSGFAAVAGKQRPGDFSLLSRAPSAPVAVAGRLSWKSLASRFAAVNRAALAKAYGKPLADKMYDMYQMWYELMDGEFAMTGDVSPTDGMWMSGEWGITDARQIKRAIKKMGALLPRSGRQSGDYTLRVKRPLRHRGVSATRIVGMPTGQFDPEAREEFEKMFGSQGMQLLVAATGTSSLMTLGKDAPARMKALIDRVKGKGKAAPPLAPALEAAVQDARQRRESVILAMDIGAFVARVGTGTGAAASTNDWLVFGLGFTQRSMTMRVTLPASAVVAMTRMKSGAPTAP